MTIAPDLVAQILRLHAAEKWRVGTIARQLHVHRDVVRRVLAGNCAPVHTSPLRPSVDIVGHSVNGALSLATRPPS